MNKNNFIGHRLSIVSTYTARFVNNIIIFKQCIKHSNTKIILYI